MSQPIDWNTIGIITGVIVAVGSLVTWYTKSTFRLGEISQRLTSVENDVKDLTLETRTMRNDLNKRIDDLIITLANNDMIGEPTVAGSKAKTKPVL